ncbi:HNH endonuclease signature motif containing protein [uncultured Streptococcus sp.]|uniref:HNH endonuclease signature motif containing protein n=1 Tax=uncultured Streptococcus sp. TaxID=83427 RepID=UPI0021B7FAE2|nr:HNH endonuclease signature motif containing protein [uncultured Streptococcus sp.]
MRRIEGMDITVKDILNTLRDESVDFVEMIGDDDHCTFDFINDLLSHYENEYITNFERLSNLQPTSVDDDNYSFSSIQNYYSEYYSGQTLYDYREYMEQLVEKRCPICDCSFAYSQVTLDHILPKSKFPFFSITPINLVPTCYNCNMRKNDGIPSKVLNPYFHSFSPFDYLTIIIKVNVEKPFESTIDINFADLNVVPLEQVMYIRENIDLYKLRQKYLDLTNIAFLKLMDEFQQVIHLNSDVYSITELKGYFLCLDNYVDSEGYKFIDESYLRHLCILTINENNEFLTCLAKHLNILVNYSDKLADSIKNLEAKVQEALINHRANCLELIKGVLPLILFIGIYELKNSFLELIDFRGVLQNEQSIFKFSPEGKYSELINSQKSFNVNESLLLSIVEPENKAGTEIVIALENGNFCILLIEGTFDINTSQIEELDSTINQILR